MNRRKLGRVISILRETFPKYRWTYNGHIGQWECEAGRAYWTCSMHDDEGGTGWSKLYFYPDVGPSIFVELRFW